MNRLRLSIVAAWTLATVGYAIFYVQEQLAANPPDLYAQTWRFQLLAFGLMRLPLLLLVLLLALIFLPRLRRPG